MTGPPPESAGPFVSVLTGAGRGAIAIVRVWGAGAVAAADAAFRPHGKTSLADTPPGRLRVGRAGAGPGDKVVAVLDAERGRVEAEVQCHGGPMAVALVVAAIEAAGAAPRPAEDWIISRAATPLAGRAEADLPLAETERAALILLDQANGALDAAIGRIIDRIDVDPSGAAGELSALLARSAVGRRLVDGWRVALAGRPNVGKSRLLNALAGYGRAIVSPTPGTTRDVVTARLAIDGWPVELADTAGLRESVDPIERGGVAAARSRHAAADLVLLVLDRSAPIADEDRALLADLPAALVVCNKADLPAAWEPEPPWLVASAERGHGLDALLASIARRLVPDSPPPGAAVPFRDAQADALAAALESLRSGRPADARSRLERLRRDAAD